ncbi:Holliday junction resolvase RuvX [Candidatus Peregrinibacteria bacterium]|nr:MAG: Holliday junction resolvase RuvX [Candidatus Peregrinibacteria bacterium]
MSNGKYLAIDFGDKRVGLAITDTTKQIAFPRDFLLVSSVDELVRQINELCEREKVTKIIIGLPIELEGAEGERAHKTRMFAKKLATAVEADIDFFDERLTTRHANQLLRMQGVKSRDQKNQRDMISAQIILESYLRSVRN